MTLDLGGLGCRERLLALGRCSILCWCSSCLVLGSGLPSMVASGEGSLFLSGLGHVVHAQPSLGPLSVLWESLGFSVRTTQGPTSSSSLGLPMPHHVLGVLFSDCCLPGQEIQKPSILRYSPLPRDLPPPSPGFTCGQSPHRCLLSSSPLQHPSNTHWR